MVSSVTFKNFEFYLSKETYSLTKYILTYMQQTQNFMKFFLLELKNVHRFLDISPRFAFM